MILLHLDFLNRLVKVRQLRGHDPNVHPYNVTDRSFKGCLIVSIKQENIDSSVKKNTVNDTDMDMYKTSKIYLSKLMKRSYIYKN